MARTLDRFMAEPSKQEIGGRRATAGDFGAGVGEDLQAMGGMVDRAGTRMVDRQEEDDARNQLVGVAKATADVDAALEHAVTTGGDVQKIQEEYQAQLNDLKASATTKKGLYVADYHGSTAAKAVQSKVRQVEARRVGTELSGAVKSHSADSSKLLQRNPELLPFVLDANRALFETYKGRLDPDLLEKARVAEEQILTVAGAKAEIERTPNFALAKLQEGEGYDTLTPQHRSELINYAQAHVREEEAAIRRKAAEKDNAQRDVDSKSASDLLVAFSNKQPIDMKAWLSNSAVSYPVRIQMHDKILQWEREPKKHTDHGLIDSVARSIHADVGDPKRIEDEQAAIQKVIESGGGAAEINSVISTFRNRDKPYNRLLETTFKQYRSMITTPDVTGMVSPRAYEAASMFREHLEGLMSAAEAARKPIGEALPEPQKLRELAMQYQAFARKSSSEKAADTLRDIEGAPSGAKPTVVPKGNLPQGLATPATTAAPVEAVVDFKSAEIMGVKVQDRAISIPGLAMEYKNGKPVYAVKDDADFAKVPVGYWFKTPDGRFIFKSRAGGSQ